MASPSSRGGGKSQVGDLWKLDWKLTSVAHGDSYKVAEHKTRTSLLVWVSRAPLDSKQQKAFRQHVGKLSSYLRVPVVTHDIDSQGVAYVVLQISGCAPLDSTRSTLLEARYTFIHCIAKIALLHRVGLVVENICLGSFVALPHNQIEFVGFLGGFSVSGPEAVPLELRAYVPPSSSKGDLVGAKADVYALALVGLRLFGAQFPPSGINPNEMEHYLARVDPAAPSWVFQVLCPIVKQSHSSALRDADDLLAALAEYERRTPVAALDVTSTQGGRRAEPTTYRLSVQELSRRALLQQKPGQLSAIKHLVRRAAAPTLIVTLLLGIAIVAELLPVGRMVNFLPQKAVSASEAPLATLKVEQQGVAIQNVKDTSFEDLVSKFERLATGDDHSSLWQMVVDKLHAGGFRNTAAITAAAANRGGGFVQQPAMVVELVQPKLSAQERVDRLHVFSESSPDLAGQLAAAFALDEPNSREVYREFLLASTRKIVSPPDATQLAERSTLALVIALDSGNETDSANAATQEHTISSADLWWLVRFHAQKRSSRLKAVLQNALDRKICEHPRRIFLLVARDAEVATDTPYEALIAAAQHGPTVQDVVRFSGWLAPQSEQALYAVLLATADSAVAIAALDGLRSKPQLDQLVVEMVNLVRAQGDSRVLEYAPLLGALGLRGMLEESLVVEGLKSVSDKPSIDQFAQKIFELGDAKIISAALPLYGSLVNPSLLLPLLGNADQRVRIRTVPLLKDLPLASSRAELSRMYAAERDPSVRAVYEQQGLSSP